MTQKDLAAKLFVSDKAVSKWERGICMPDISLIEKLSNVLDASVSEILKGDKLVEMTKQNSDEIVKKSVSFFQREYFKKKLIKIGVCIAIFLTFGYLALLIIGEFNNNELKWSIWGSEYYMDMPSFSLIKAKNSSKKFLKAIQNYDYETIENLIMEHESREYIYDVDWISIEEYISILKDIKKEGLILAEYKIDYCYNYSPNHTCMFDLTFEYKGNVYKLSTQLKSNGKNVYLDGGQNIYSQKQDDMSIAHIENRELLDKIEKIFFKY